MFEYVEIYEDKLDKLEQLKNEKITINNTHLNYDHSLYFELKTAKKGKQYYNCIIISSSNDH